MHLRNVFLISAFIFAAGLAAIGQETTARRENEIIARVAALTERLYYRDQDPRDTDRYFNEMDGVTARLRDEIDTYVQGVVDLRETSEEIQARLRKLVTRTPNPVYGDASYVRAAELPVGRSLLIAYTIVRPPHHNWATVRGYVEKGNRFELVASAGQDFEGFNMFKHELRSPLPGEIWLMAWGQAQGGNGKIVRFRVYAFDGRTFRTMWSPEEMLNATVSFSDMGFAIDHYRRPNDVHDEYLLTSNGVVKTN
jgi:hypothetical protein